MRWILGTCLLVLALLVLAPFRLSSRESRAEEQELREREDEHGDD